jgi:hypothetical protein
MYSFKDALLKNEPRGPLNDWGSIPTNNGEHNHNSIHLNSKICSGTINFFQVKWAHFSIQWHMAKIIGFTQPDHNGVEFGNK